MMKISLKWLLVESSKLQDHRQQSCVICNMTIESAALPGHGMKTNVDRSERSCVCGYLVGVVDWWLGRRTEMSVVSVTASVWSVSLNCLYLCLSVTMCVSLYLSLSLLSKLHCVLFACTSLSLLSTCLSACLSVCSDIAVCMCVCVPVLVCNRLCQVWVIWKPTKPVYRPSLIPLRTSCSHRYFQVENWDFFYPVTMSLPTDFV